MPFWQFPETHSSCLPQGLPLGTPDAGWQKDTTQWPD
jgi:hypothetical protein